MVEVHPLIVTLVLWPRHRVVPLSRVGPPRLRCVGSNHNPDIGTGSSQGDPVDDGQSWDPSGNHFTVTTLGSTSGDRASLHQRELLCDHIALLSNNQSITVLVHISCQRTAVILHYLRHRSPGLVRRLRRYYRAVRLPTLVHLRITALALPERPHLRGGRGISRFSRMADGLAGPVWVPAGLLPVLRQSVH